MSKLPPGEGRDPMAQEDQRPTWATQEEENKFVKEREKDIKTLWGCLVRMPGKYRIVLEDLYTVQANGPAEKIIEDLAAVGVKIDMDPSGERGPDNSQLEPLVNEAFAIVEDKTGFSREEAIKMLYVVDQVD